VGPLAITFDGVAGRRGEVAALELGVHASEPVPRPIVEVQLPAGVLADADLLAALAAQGAVADVEARAPGFLRFRLGPMAAEADVRISLPLRFLGSGRVRGLGAVAYPEAEPQRTTVLRPRSLSL
jgi:hypothetical protein